MRVLILTQYYPPESGAPQNRLSDLARRLVRQGHQVTVLTGFPNYPAGRIFDSYRGRMRMAEMRDGARVIRTWVYASPDKRFLPRLLNYLSFTASALLLGWPGRQDIVLVESPPLFLGLSGVVLSRLCRGALIFNVSDLWPESAVAMGVLHNPTLIRFATALEEFIYRCAALVTGQTQGIVDNIRARCPGKRVELITNGVDVDLFQSATLSASKASNREAFGLHGKFVVGYAGLHGLAQGLHTAIEAARILRTQPDLVFAFFGDGPEKPRLMQLATQYGLTNVRFFENQRASSVPAVLSAFDVALIPLRNLPLFKGALPSKMFEAMAAGLPLVVSVEGEARVLTRNARAGLCVPPEHPTAMAAAIRRLQRWPRLRTVLGQNGRRYVTEHFDRRQIGERFERLMTDLRLALEP